MVSCLLHRKAVCDSSEVLILNLKSGVQAPLWVFSTWFVDLSLWKANTFRAIWRGVPKGRLQIGTSSPGLYSVVPYHGED